MDIRQTKVRSDEDGTLYIKGRLCYANIIKPSRVKNDPNNRLTYNTLLLLPRWLDITLLQKIYTEKMKAEFGPKFAENTKLYTALRKTAAHDKLGDEYGDEYPWHVVAKSGEDYPPTIFGPDTKPITAPTGSQVYSGRWAIISGPIYTYNKVSKGSNLSLNRVQLCEHDERFGGAMRQDAGGFEAFDVPDEDSAFEDEDTAF